MPAVLIIDDEPGIRYALRRFFERAHWRVLEAADGDSAWRQLRDAAADLDVVVLDLRLPGRSGTDLLAQLRRELPSLAERVILTTGDAVHDAEPGSLLAEHRWVLQKPFELAALWGVVERVTGSKDGI